MPARCVPRIWRSPGRARICRCSTLKSIDTGQTIPIARSWAAGLELEAGHVVRLFDYEVSAEYAYWAVWNGGSARRALIASFVDWLAPLFDGRP